MVKSLFSSLLISSTVLLSTASFAADAQICVNAASGQFDKVILALNQGVSPDTKCGPRSEQTLFDAVASQGADRFSDAERTLLVMVAKGVDPKATSTWRFRRHRDEIETLPNSYVAASWGYAEVVRQFINAGLDPDYLFDATSPAISTSRGWYSMLMGANYGFKHPSLVPNLAGTIEVHRILLAKGANPHKIWVRWDGTTCMSLLWGFANHSSYSDLPAFYEDFVVDLVNGWDFSKDVCGETIDGYKSAFAGESQRIELALSARSITR